MQEAHLRKLWSHDLPRWGSVRSMTPFASGVVFEKIHRVPGHREFAVQILYDNGDLETFVNYSLFEVCEGKPVLKRHREEGWGVATVAGNSLELMYADRTPICTGSSHLPAFTKCIASMAGRLLLVHGRSCCFYDMIIADDKRVTMQLARSIQYDMVAHEKIRGYSGRDFFVTCQGNVYRVWDRDMTKVFEISLSGFHRFVGVVNGSLYVNFANEIRRFDIRAGLQARCPFWQFPPYSVGLATLYPGVAVFTTTGPNPIVLFLWDGYRAEHARGIGVRSLTTTVHTYGQRIYVHSPNTISCYLREVPSLANLCTEHLGNDLIARLDKLPIECRERVDSLRCAIAAENGVVGAIN